MTLGTCATTFGFVLVGTYGRPSSWSTARPLPQKIKTADAFRTCSTMRSELQKIKTPDVSRTRPTMRPEHKNIDARDVAPDVRKKGAQKQSSPLHPRRASTTSTATDRSTMVDEGNCAIDVSNTSIALTNHPGADGVEGTGVGAPVMVDVNAGDEVGNEDPESSRSGSFFLWSVRRWRIAIAISNKPNDQQLQEDRWEKKEEEGEKTSG